MSDEPINEIPQTSQPEESATQESKSHLWNQSFFARTLGSYLLIAGSSAVGLIFVFIAQLDSAKTTQKATLRKELQSPQLISNNNEASQIQAAEKETSGHHQTAAVSESALFIQQAMHEENSHTQQPDRVELTSGGDFSGDSPVRLLGVIEFVEEPSATTQKTNEQPNVSLEVVPLSETEPTTTNPFEQLNNQ